MTTCGAAATDVSKMQALSRAPLSALARSNNVSFARNMSSHASPEENEKWMKLWTYTTYAATPVLIGLGFYMMSQSHDHHEQPKYPYLKKRDKPKFPWGSSCDLFDFHCAAHGAEH